MDDESQDSVLLFVAERGLQGSGRDRGDGGGFRRIVCGCVVVVLLLRVRILQKPGQLASDEFLRVVHVNHIPSLKKTHHHFKHLFGTHCLQLTSNNSQHSKATTLNLALSWSSSSLNRSILGTA